MGIGYCVVTRSGQCLSNSGFVKNPFKIGEKVLTKVGGNEVEAVVTKLWQKEVQMRIDGQCRDSGGAGVP